jgi:hypothetical protein
MAAEFKILVGADLDAAVKSINDFVKTTKNGFANVDAAVVASTNEFKKLQSELNRSKDPVAIAAIQKKMQELASTLSTQIPPAADKAAKAVDNIGKASVKTTVAVKGMNTAAAATVKGVNNVQGSSNRASFAVLNLGRIAQDSAFGFIGIANNIEPFIQSLTALRRESSSAKGALAAFFSSLAGPAGIGLVIGAISLFDAWSKGYGVFAGKNKEANKEQEYSSQIIKKLNVEYADQKELLKAVTAAQIANSNAGIDQISIYNALSESVRKYITNLGKQELVKELLPQYNKIVSVALDAQKQLERIDLGLELLDPEDEAKERDLLNRRIKNSEKQIINAQKLFNKVGGGAKGLASILGVDDAKVETEKAVKVIEKLTQAQSDNAAFLAQNIALRNADLTVQKATTEEIERANAALKERNRLQALSPLGAGLGPQAIGGNIAAKAVGDILNAKKLADELRDADAAAFKLSENATFAAGQLTTLFNASFQAISQGQSPIEAITNSLKGLIVRLAAAAAAAALLSALLPGNTAIGSIVAGGGKGFGALFGSLLGLASGGIATRPMPALIGDGGPEAVIPLSQLANIIGGVAMQMGTGSGGGLSIVRGQDIYYSNNNASRSFGRLFG